MWSSLNPPPQQKHNFYLRHQLCIYGTGCIPPPHDTSPRTGTDHRRWTEPVDLQLLWWVVRWMLYWRCYELCSLRIWSRRISLYLRSIWLRRIVRYERLLMSAWNWYIDHLLRSLWWGCSGSCSTISISRCLGMKRPYLSLLRTVKKLDYKIDPTVDISDHPW